MEEILLFGATGHLGRAIASALKERNLQFTAVVRNQDKAGPLEAEGIGCRVADVTSREQLSGICNGYDAVISALGKSVSLEDKSKPTFEDIDLHANSRILEEAVKSGVRKFVYVSALHAERYPHLTYFRTHQQFSEKLINSGLDYSIVKPPALFSAFLELLPLARKGRLMLLGKGDYRTNPIWEGDLAQICIDALHQPNTVIEAGGKEILTRRQINELIQQAAAPGKKIGRLPLGLMSTFLPVIRYFNRNLYDKMSFFLEVMKEDVVAPAVGTRKLGDYLREKVEMGS